MVHVPKHTDSSGLAAAHTFDAIDRALIAATQGGLPLVAEPWRVLGEPLGLQGEEVLARFVALRDAGVLRRIAAVPNHYALGWRANGMTVWNVDDARAGELGEQVGALPFVSHCYLRPRRQPGWPYNLFAMVHARSREQAMPQVEEIRVLLGDACRAHDVLWSTRILKKTGLRLPASRRGNHV
ncbi:Lrp/AsnC family transcriptional regulator [Cupriavidus sp. SW-Y-13]|nr:Lrp/AsnC family transcriptional regulator [Cupriavidus sp. SW-Y-13]